MNVKNKRLNSTPISHCIQCGQQMKLFNPWSKSVSRITVLNGETAHTAWMCKYCSTFFENEDEDDDCEGV